MTPKKQEENENNDDNDNGTLPQFDGWVLQKLEALEVGRSSQEKRGPCGQLEGLSWNPGITTNILLIEFTSSDSRILII